MTNARIIYEPHMHMSSSQKVCCSTICKWNTDKRVQNHGELSFTAYSYTFRRTPIILCLDAQYFNITNLLYLYSVKEKVPHEKTKHSFQIYDKYDSWIPIKINRNKLNCIASLCIGFIYYCKIQFLYTKNIHSDMRLFEQCECIVFFAKPITFNVCC